MVRTGGRPPTLTAQEILRAGRALGMRELSVSAVANDLGVTPAALYRHVDGRWGLERLVGESILAELRLVDDPDEALTPHLVGFGLQLYDFCLARPGIGAYLQQLFPRGDHGRALLVAEVECLRRRGLDIDGALAVANAIAAVAIGLAVSDERRSGDRTPAGFEAEADAVVRELDEDAVVGPAHQDFPMVDQRSFTGLVLSATATGLAATDPTARPLGDIVADLARRGGVDVIGVR